MGSYDFVCFHEKSNITDEYTYENRTQNKNNCLAIADQLEKQQIYAAVKTNLRKWFQYTT